MPQPHRDYWLWVTGPDYYLDDDGRDRRDLEPGLEYEPGGWWTCHRDTEKGDLVLLYRRKPRRDKDELYDLARGRHFQDIAYLIVAKSDAYSLLGQPAAEEMGWDYGCDFEVIDKYSDLLRWDQMKHDPALADWTALKRRFQGRAHPIPPRTWDHLLERLNVSPRRVQRRAQTARRLMSRESEIEDVLAENPARIPGLRLKLVARQLITRNGGRADLVFLDLALDRYIVAEVKRAMAGRNAVAQVLSYMASIKVQMPKRRSPVGLIVADRIDNEAAGMIEADPKLSFLSLAELGLT